MTKHTEGPWSRNIPPATKYPTIFAGRNTHVARVVTRGLPPKEVEANCDLIAAAPDLLAALKLASVEIEVQLGAYIDGNTVGGNLATLDDDAAPEYGRLTRLSTLCRGAINRAERVR